MDIPLLSHARVKTMMQVRKKMKETLFTRNGDHLVTPGLMVVCIAMSLVNQHEEESGDIDLFARD